MKKDLIKQILLTLFFILVAYVTFLIYTFVVSHGSMDLFKREYMGINYVNTWDQLLKGRFDLDPKIIDFGETYIREGKRYMYFGPFPAFLRGFLKLFPNPRITDWSRISCLIAAFVVVITCTLAYWKITGIVNAASRTRWFYTSIFAICVAFGSFLVILLASAYIFDECKIWGLANGCIFILAFVNWWFSKKNSLFLPFVMSTSGGFGLLSQPTFGVFPILMSVILSIVVCVSYLSSLQKASWAKVFLNWLGWRKQAVSGFRTFFVCLAFLVPAFLAITFQMKLNYEKMGNPFVMMDYRYYELCQGDKGRLELWLMSRGVVDYSRITHALTYYFIPHEEHFSYNFPFIDIGGYKNIFKFKDTWFDMVEPGSPVEITSSYLFINAVIGLFLLGNVFGGIGLFLLLSFILSSATFFSFQAMSGRYPADLMPMFVVFSLASFKLINWLDSRNLFFRMVLRLGLAILVLISIYTANITMLKIKLFYWSVPEPAKEPIRSFFERGDEVINYVLSRALRNESVLKISQQRSTSTSVFPPFPSPGQLWTPDGNKTIFWYDGRHWNLIKDDSGTYIGPITLLLRFNVQAGQSEPILTSGLARIGDTVYVRYLDGNKAIIGFDFWGSHGFPSEPFIVDPNRVYLLEISFGSFYSDPRFTKLRRRLLVKLDGKIIIDKETPFHPITIDQIAIGQNTTECGVCRAKFTGDILEARRVGKKIILNIIPKADF